MSRYSVIAIVLLFWNCAGIQKSALNKRLTNLEESYNHHIGFSLYDPVKEKMLYEFNGTKYFIPASNTKILTFYTSIKSLQDSLITFYYKEKNDSLLLWPAGDPTFLNPEFPESEVLNDLISKDKELFISFRNSSVEGFGPGWSWADYPYIYSAERAALPLYGNYYTITSNNQQLSITVPFFKQYLALSDSSDNIRFSREPFSNDVIFNPGKVETSGTFNIPFKTSPWLSARLLSDTLQRQLYVTNEPFDSTAKAIKSLPVDTAYKKMMHESNNFVAEQLLLQCAAVVLDTLDQRSMINYSLNNYLDFLPQRPFWVDGSGLSRYNLITPNSLVALWSKIYSEFGTEEIFPLLATGGKVGTLKNYYKTDPPYIFGKTGTLRNNHNLSGYMITKKGKLMIFSFMNNNYPTSSTPVKKQMEKILWEIHLNN